jgi:colicin import membrane protein
VYSTQLVEKIRQFWALPSYLLDKGLNCRVQVFISKKGILIDYKITESSGNNEYDKLAIRSVIRAAPFVSPPSSLRRRLLKGELIFGFPL